MAKDSVSPPSVLRAGLPNRDTQLLESPYVWVSDQAEVHEQVLGIPSNLWAVDGKLYDLSEFVDKHPGGPAFLKLTRGTDVTAMFVVHHLNEAKCESVLKKFYVADCPKPALPPGEPSRAFSFDPDGFYMTLKRRVVEEIGLRPSTWRAAPHMLAVCWTTLFAFLAGFTGMCLSSGSSPYLFAVASAFALHALLGVGHNFFHQPDTPWRYTFDLSMFSHHHWRISHAISHHMNPNLETDTEVSSFEPFIYFLTNKPKNGFLVYVSFHLLLFFASILDFIRRVVAILLLREEFRWEYLTPVVQAWLCVWFQGFQTGMSLFVVMQGFASWLLISISFAVHRSEHAYTEGDRGEVVQDYGEHILATTDDHSPDASLLASLWCYAGLNHHQLHHLFPTLDHSRLWQLDPILTQTVKDFNLKRRIHKSFLPLWFSVFQRHGMFKTSSK